MITKNELLEQLETKGIKIGGNPDRMLTRFISLGLIGKPERFGLGKGKGSVSKFDEKVVEKIEMIVNLRKAGLTYSQIKEMQMEYDHWFPLVKTILEQTTSERGERKRTDDLFTEAIVRDFLFAFNPRALNVPKERLAEHIFDSIQACLRNLTRELSLMLEDYEGYREGKTTLVFPSNSDEFDEWLSGGKEFKFPSSFGTLVDKAFPKNKPLKGGAK